MSLSEHYFCMFNSIINYYYSRTDSTFRIQQTMLGQVLEKGRICVYEHEETITVYQFNIDSRVTELCVVSLPPVKMYFMS